jgi:aspartyl aminopeptidase
MAHLLTDLKAFLESSLTSWHAVREIANRLAFCDFLLLNEEEKWDLRLGGRYFVVRGGSLLAFSLPQTLPRSALLLASHTDSPALKLKPSPLYRTENMIQVATEVYGSPLLSSWMNRDLTIAGRVVILNHEGVKEDLLVHIDDAIAFIPQLAIHLDREVNEKGLLLNKQDHLNPILGLAEPHAQPREVFEMLLRRHLSFHSLLSFELFLAPSEPARFIGLDHEMIASYRIDNLVGAHAALSAMGKTHETPSEQLRIALFLDHEEIGANTVFVSDLLERISHCLKLDVEALAQLKRSSLCVSIDSGHALNPNYPGKLDPHHLPLLGKGILLKQSASQKYATEASALATIIQACHTLNLPYQPYVARSDLPSGSTLGPLLAKQTGISSVDIGCPQLAMHAAREVIATRDYLDLVHLLTHLLKGAHGS